MEKKLQMEYNRSEIKHLMNMLKQDRGRSIYNQKYLAFLGLIILILISFPISNNIRQRHKINKEINNLNQEIQGMENRNSDLKQLISYLESDEYVEEQARLNLGLKKPGENVAVIKEKNTSENVSESPEKKLTNPQKWIKFFLK